MAKKQRNDNETAENETKVEETVETTEKAEESVEKTEEKVENPIASKLSGAVKEVTDEIEQCDREIEKLDKKREEILAKKEQLCRQFQEAVNDMQSRFGLESVAKESVAKKSSGGKREKKPDGSSVKDLVLSYLQKHGQARAIHIRQFLTAKGRKTNPGSDLSRLVKDGVVRNVERGVYEMVVDKS